MLEMKQVKSESDFPDGLTREAFVEFLHKHLGQFGDSKSAINKSIEYAFSEEAGKGGYLLVAYHRGELVGAVVINDTGMSEYVPEHLLVYIAVNEKYRNRGFGAEVLEKSLEMCEGSVALHVEYENPAKRFYLRNGFGTKYAEMRFFK